MVGEISSITNHQNEHNAYHPARPLSMRRKWHELCTQAGTAQGPLHQRGTCDWPDTIAAWCFPRDKKNLGACKPAIVRHEARHTHTYRHTYTQYAPWGISCANLRGKAPHPPMGLDNRNQHGAVNWGRRPIVHSPQTGAHRKLGGRSARSTACEPLGAGRGTDADGEGSAAA